MRARTAMAMAIVVFGTGSTPAAADRSTPFELTAHGGVVVAGTLDGHGPFRFLLDTGSTHTVMTSRLARAIGARPVAKATITSATGPVMAPVISVDCLRIGPVAASVMPSVVDTLPIDGEADGVVGQDVLAGLRYTIDYRRRMVVWHDMEPATTARDAEGLPVTIVDGRFVVDVEIDGRLVPMVVDTGSEALVLFEPPAGGRGSRRGRAATLGAAGGEVDTDIDVLERLRVGPVEQRFVSMVRIDRPMHAGAPRGLLPTHGFGRVTVDGPGRRVVLEAR